MDGDLYPSNTDVSEDSFAIIIYNDGQVIYKFEKPSPWDDPEWIKKKSYNHDEVPNLELGSCKIEQRTELGKLKKVVVYASEITDTKINEGDQQPNTENNLDKHKNINGYKIVYSDGKAIPSKSDADRNQKINSGKAIDYLMSNYGLIDKIDIPYYNHKTFSNPQITDSKTVTKEIEWDSPYQLTGGLYLRTAIDLEMKRNILSILAGLCNTRLRIDEKFQVKFQDGTTIPENTSVDMDQIEVLGQSIEHLISNYSLMEYIDVPYYPTDDFSTPVISEMKGVRKRIVLDNPYELLNNFYYNHNISKTAKMKLVESLADRCDLNADFYGDWN